MSGATTYAFFAIHKPLTSAQRAEVSTLSRRVNPTARRADFSYHVDGYDIPGGHKKLLAKYYDVMAREDYGQWSLAFVLPYAKDLEAALRPYACDSCGYGDVVAVEKLSPQRLLVEITAFMAWEDIESIKGLRDFPWDRAADENEDEDEDDEEDDGDDDEFSSDDSDLLEKLARLANCIREDVLNGDYRALYLAWDRLHCRDDKEPDDDEEDEEIEKPAPPPKPDNLKTLPPYLKGFKQMLHDEMDF